MPLTLCLPAPSDTESNVRPIDRLSVSTSFSSLSLPRSSISTELVRILTLYGVVSAEVSFGANLETCTLRVAMPSTVIVTFALSG